MPSNTAQTPRKHHQQAQGDKDDMTTSSQELPPLGDNSRERSEIGSLEVFSGGIASSQPKKNRRDKKKNRRDGKNGRDDVDEPAATPSSPSNMTTAAGGLLPLNDNEAEEWLGDFPKLEVFSSKPASKKRKNLELSDEADRKKRKSHAATDSSPPTGRSHQRSLPGDIKSGIDVGSDSDGLSDVEALVREACEERFRNQTMQQPHEVTDGAPQSPAEASEAPAEPAEPEPRRARSTRKKSKPTYFDQPFPNAAIEAFGQSPSPSAVTTPTTRRTKKAAPKKTAQKKGSRRQRKADSERDMYSDAAKSSYKQGKFDEEELLRVRGAVESFRAEHHLEQREVNEMIQAPGGTAAGEAHAQLWARIFAECPDRHRQKVINVARKKFHNFVARGTWTVEQDEELSALINTHGPKWSYIAPIINRHPEDIRDRYRNYLICGGAQKKEAWDDEEEARLTQLVQFSMAGIDEMRMKHPDRVDLQKTYEELLDWQNISICMGRTRSRLQCITKWKSMNLRIHSKDKLASADPDSNISFRLEKARRQLEDMPDTEKYRLVLAINSASTTAKIPWHKLCDKQFRNLWHRSTQELVWSRLVKSVPGSKARTVRDCAQYLVDKYDQDGELPNIAGEGWDDEEEMKLIFGGKNTRQGISDETLTQEDMLGDDEELVTESREVQIDPALHALAEVPRSAQKTTPARRSQNGKRPSARMKYE